MSVIAVTTDVSFFEVLTHEQVERATGVDARACDGRAAVAQQSQTEVGALLRLLLEQQLRKLKTKKNKFKQYSVFSLRITQSNLRDERALRCEHVYKCIRTLVESERGQQHFEDVWQHLRVQIVVCDDVDDELDGVQQHHARLRRQTAVHVMLHTHHLARAGLRVETRRHDVSRLSPLRALLAPAQTRS